MYAYCSGAGALKCETVLPFRLQGIRAFIFVVAVHVECLSEPYLLHCKNQTINVCHEHILLEVSIKQ